MKRLRVLTYNIHHGQGTDGMVSLRRIAATIREHNPDLVALQEVDCFLPRSCFNHQAFILACLLGMNYVFYGVRRWLSFMQYGNAVLSNCRLSEHHNLILPAEAERRALLKIRVEPENHPVFCFLNTHLGLSKGERRRQIEEIAGVIQQLKMPIILAGDFNAEPAVDEMKNLASRLRFASFSIPTFPAYAPKFCLDHILVSSHWVVLRSAIVQSTASDHLPLVVDLEHSLL